MAIDRLPDTDAAAVMKDRHLMLIYPRPRAGSAAADRVAVYGDVPSAASLVSLADGRFADPSGLVSNVVSR